MKDEQNLFVFTYLKIRCVLLFLVTFSVSILVILLLGHLQVQSDKEFVQHSIVEDFADQITSQITRLSVSAYSLGTYLKGIHSSSKINQTRSNFPIIAKEIMEWSEMTGYLHFDSIIDSDRLIYPSTNETPIILGWDYINQIELRKRAMTEKEFYFGPFQREIRNEIKYLFFVFIPLWVPLELNDELNACPLDSTDCFNRTSTTPCLCINQTTQQKFYGFSRSTHDLTALINGTFGPLYGLTHDHNYLVKLTAHNEVLVDLGINEEKEELQIRILYVTSPPPHDPVRFTFHVGNLHWGVALSPSDGWFKTYWWKMLGVVFLLDGVLCFLIYWMLSERKLATTLLNSILPPQAITHLYHTPHIPFAESFSSVTILFCDIVNYTPLSSKLTPGQIVELLNELYSQYDELMMKHGTYKVETIGDAFMAVAGCPISDDPVISAHRIAALAQDILSVCGSFRHPHLELAGYSTLQTRIGISSGPCVGGVVGTNRPRYCLFGDVVNTASRMESNSLPMKIHVSPTTAELLQITPDKTPPTTPTGTGLGTGARSVFRTGTSTGTTTAMESNSFHFHRSESLECRGEIEVKGKGKMTTYWLSPSHSYAGSENGDVESESGSERRKPRGKMSHEHILQKAVEKILSSKRDEEDDYSVVPTNIAIAVPI